MDLGKLKNPFPANDIEWRVQSAGESNGKPWARVLAYVTNRAIMDRLDEVCSPEAWRNEYCAGPQGGIICGLSIKCGGEWITKWDGAENTDIESVKGGLSNAMKRAAVQWGIGRYLYNLEAGYADITTAGSHYQGADKNGKYKAFKWNAPNLPAWAMPPDNQNQPTNDAKDQQPDPLVDEYLLRFQDAGTLDELKTIFEGEYKAAAPDNRGAIVSAKNLRKKELSNGSKN